MAGRTIDYSISMIRVRVDVRVMLGFHGRAEKIDISWQVVGSDWRDYNYNVVYNKAQPSFRKRPVRAL